LSAVHCTQWFVESQAGAPALQSVASVATVHWTHLPGVVEVAPSQRSPFARLQSLFDAQPTLQVSVVRSQKCPVPRAVVQSIGCRQATQFPDGAQRGWPATVSQLLSKTHCAHVPVFELQNGAQLCVLGLQGGLVAQSVSMVHGAAQTLFELHS
jgi:hypothetical protein